ncbi:MAG: ABC transporter ATP-binding protein [Candidatus Eisenbacteria bacterium]
METVVTGIHVAEVSKTYRAGKVRALDRVSLEIRAGETFGIIGPNGAGKTTLVGCLLGLLRADSGTITLDGHPPDDLAVRRQTGYLPERLVLDRWMSGLDFLAYHHALAELDPGTRRADCEAAIARVGLEPLAGRQAIRRFSRGMLQRLGLAQALLGQPRFVFLDEPISGVDPAGVMLFRRLLLELKATGATVIVNSHQLAEVERICDRVAFVKGGQVQSVETVTAGAELQRVLAVRWAAATPGAAVTAAALGAVAAQAGAAVAALTPPVARFTVADDEGATRLLHALLAAGVRVIEASPEGGRLERLFGVDAAGSATRTDDAYKGPAQESQGVRS